MSQMERIFFLNRMIRKNGKVTVRQVHERFEVSDRQVKRDIEYMRNRLNAPIDYSHDLHGYHFSGPFDLLQQADEKTLLYYSIIKNLSENPQVCPVVSDEIQNRILSFLPQEYRRLTRHIRYQNEEWEEISLNQFMKLLESLLDERKLKVEYRNVEGKTSKRIIEPLEILSYAGRWYCIAFDSKRDSVRNFLLTRILSMETSLESFEHPVSEKELNRFLSETFGIFKGKKRTPVRVRFYEESLPLVERLVFHPEQKTSIGKDPSRGEYREFILPVGDYRELIGKLLRYGASAEAIEPEDFRSEWLEKIETLAKRYLPELKKTPKKKSAE